MPNGSSQGVQTSPKQPYFYSGHLLQHIMSITDLRPSAELLYFIEMLVRLKTGSSHPQKTETINHFILVH